jgi:hypothetical protein
MRVCWFVTVGLVTLALAGCASYSWIKPGMTQEEWQRDSYECQRDANLLPASPLPYYPYPSYMPYGGQAQSQIAAIQAQDAARRQATLEACLQSKGYTRVTN